MLSAEEPEPVDAGAKASRFRADRRACPAVGPGVLMRR